MWYSQKSRERERERGKYKRKEIELLKRANISRSSGCAFTLILCTKQRSSNVAHCILTALPGVHTNSVIEFWLGQRKFCSLHYSLLHLSGYLDVCIMYKRPRYNLLIKKNALFTYLFLKIILIHLERFIIYLYQTEILNEEMLGNITEENKREKHGLNNLKVPFLIFRALGFRSS